MMFWRPHEGYQPGDLIVCERFCTVCACSQRGVDSDPCWNCGSDTTPTRPGFWPVGGANQMVIGGNAFGVNELEDFDETTIRSTTSD